MNLDEGPARLSSKGESPRPATPPLPLEEQAPLNPVLTPEVAEKIRTKKTSKPEVSGESAEQTSDEKAEGIVDKIIGKWNEQARERSRSRSGDVNTPEGEHPEPAPAPTPTPENSVDFDIGEKTPIKRVDLYSGNAKRTRFDLNVGDKGEANLDFDVGEKETKLDLDLSGEENDESIPTLTEVAPDYPILREVVDEQTPGQDLDMTLSKNADALVKQDYPILTDVVDEAGQEDIGKTIPRDYARDETLEELKQETPGALRKILGSLVERVSTKKGESAPEEETDPSGRSGFLKSRASALGTRLKQFGTNVLADVGAVVRGAAYAAEKPIDTLNKTVHAAGYGVGYVTGYLKYLADGSRSLGERGDRLSKHLKGIIDGYNHLPFRYKSYLTAALILGSGGAAAAGLPTFHSILAGGAYGQRALGGIGFGINRRRGMEKKIEKKKESGEEHWLANKSDAFKNTYAAALSGAYFTSTFLGAHFAIEKISEWLGHAGGHAPALSSSDAAPAGPAAVGEHIGSAVATPEHLQPGEPIVPGHVEVPGAPAEVPAHHAVEAAAAPPVPEIPSITVHATYGEGYEHMLKEMWRRLHDNPPNLEHMSHNSDLYKLATADANSIGAVAHQIAADPSHGFFNPDGSSAIIRPDDALAFNDHGQAVIMTDNNYVGVHTPPGVGFRHPVHTEVSAPAPEPPLAHETLPSTEHTPTIDAATHPGAEQPPAPVETAHATPAPPPPPPSTPPEPAVWHSSDGSVVTTGDGSPLQTGLNAPPAHVEAPISAPLGEPPPVPIEFTAPFANQAGVQIDPTHAHVFADTNGALLSYGNDYGERLALAQEYVAAHHDAAVWVQAEKTVSYDGAWHPWAFEVTYADGGAGAHVAFPENGVPGPGQMIGHVEPQTFVKPVE